MCIYKTPSGAFDLFFLSNKKSSSLVFTLLFVVKKSKKGLLFPSLSLFFCSSSVVVSRIGCEKTHFLLCVRDDVFLSFFAYARRVLSFSRSDAMLFSSLLEREKLFSPQNKGALCSLSLSLSL